MRNSDPVAGHYIIEFTTVSPSLLRVSAIDPESGLEVCITGSPSIPRRQLIETVVQKLEYRLKRP